MVEAIDENQNQAENKNVPEVGRYICDDCNFIFYTGTWKNESWEEHKEETSHTSYRSIGNFQLNEIPINQILIYPVQFLSEKGDVIRKEIKSQVPCNLCDDTFDNQLGVSTHKGKAHRGKQNTTAGEDLWQKIINLVNSSDKLYWTVRDLSFKLDIERRHMNQILNDHFVENEFIKRAKIGRPWFITKNSNDWIMIKEKMNEGIKASEVLNMELYDLVTRYNVDHDNLTYIERYEQYVYLFNRLSSETELKITEIYQLFKISDAAQWQMLKIEEYCDCLKVAFETNIVSAGALWSYRNDTCEVHQEWLNNLGSTSWIRPKNDEDEKSISLISSSKVVRSMESQLEKNLFSYINLKGKIFYHHITSSYQFRYMRKLDVDRSLGKLLKNKFIIAGMEEKQTFYFVNSQIEDEIRPEQKAAEDKVESINQIKKSKNKAKVNKKIDLHPNTEKIFDLIKKYEEIDIEDLSGNMNFSKSKIAAHLEILVEKKLIVKHKSPVLDNEYFSLLDENAE